MSLSFTVAWWAWPLILLIPACLFAMYDHATDSGVAQGCIGAIVFFLVLVGSVGWWLAGAFFGGMS